MKITGVHRFRCRATPPSNGPKPNWRGRGRASKNTSKPNACASNRHLLAARERDEDYASFVADAYTASQNLRDVAGSVGYPLIGFVAANLCTIIETADAVQMQYPASVIDCFFEALRLVQGRDYVEKTPKDLPHLTAGLLQTVELTKAMAVRTAQSAKQAS